MTDTATPPSFKLEELPEGALVQSLRQFMHQGADGAWRTVRMYDLFVAADPIVRSHPREFVPHALPEAEKARIQRQMFDEDAEEFNRRQRAYYRGEPWEQR